MQLHKFTHSQLATKWATIMYECACAAVSTYLSALISDGLNLVSSKSGVYSPLRRARRSALAVRTGILLVGVRTAAELLAFDGVGETD